MCDTFSDCANCVVYRYKCLSHHGGECCVCGNLLCQTYAAAYNQFGPHAIAIIRHFTPAVHRGLVTPFPDKDGWLRLEWELERTLRHEVLVYVMKRCNFLVKQGVSVDCDFMGGIRKELRKEHQWKGERSAFLQTRDEVNTAEMKLESVEDLPWDDEYEPKGREWFHSQLRELALRTAHELAQIKPGEAFMELGRFQQEQEVQKEVVAPSRPLPRDEKGNVLLCNFDYDPILNDKGKPIVAESATLTDLPSCSYVEYFTFQPWMVTPYEINWVLLQYPFSKPILTRLKLYWDRWRPLAGWAGSDVDTGEIDFYLGGDVIADTLIEVAEDELWKEAEWTLGLKVVMARLIVESREEVAHELHDSMHVCLIKFSRAILIALLNAMLPSEEDAEAEKVTADDIRAGRRRRGKAQRYNIPDKKKKVPWNIDLIEDVMTALSERWFIESEENSFENASYFLGRCLALANLTSWTEGIFRVGRSMPALALDSLSHVMFVKHEIEEAVSIAAAEVIVWTIPAAQDALKQVRLLLGDYYDKVSYFVETLTVLELQTLHKVSRRVNSAASRVVQEIMFELATWREEICTAEDNALDKALSEAGDSDDGSFRVKQKAKKKVPAVCNELYETRKFVYTVRQHIGLRHAVDICKYIQITNRRQNELVTLNLTSISDAPVLGEADDEDFTVLQLREVEWVLTGQTEKPLPASFTPLIEMGMIVGVVGGLVTMAVLGSTLEVEAITRWFFLHSVALFLCIFVFGPTKAVWHKDWGWTPPWEVVLEARKRRQLEDQTRERDGSAKKEESKVLPKEQDEEEEPLKELKIVDVTPAD
nr:hypothetical protein BaRGS_034471 [Batillaria attramentaria]